MLMTGGLHEKSHSPHLALCPDAPPSGCDFMPPGGCVPKMQALRPSTSSPPPGAPPLPTGSSILTFPSKAGRQGRPTVAAYPPEHRETGREAWGGAIFKVDALFWHADLARKTGPFGQPGQR
jgi:hypothetical protein